eukprot:6030426-Heterocapsa_arctica.AAC.1
MVIARMPANIQTTLNTFNHLQTTSKPYAPVCVHSRSMLQTFYTMFMSVTGGISWVEITDRLYE